MDYDETIYKIWNQAKKCIILKTRETFRSVFQRVHVGATFI